MNVSASDRARVVVIAYDEPEGWVEETRCALGALLDENEDDEVLDAVAALLRGEPEAIGGGGAAPLWRLTLTDEPLFVFGLLASRPSAGEGSGA